MSTDAEAGVMHVPLYPVHVATHTGVDTGISGSATAHSPRDDTCKANIMTSVRSTSVIGSKREERRNGERRR